MRPLEDAPKTFLLESISASANDELDDSSISLILCNFRESKGNFWERKKDFEV